MKHTTIFYIVFAALGFVACDPEFENSVKDNQVYQSGDADFTKYVALGNSLTAGYADGALYLQGQQNSYPKMMAEQFSHVAGAFAFSQPLMQDNLGGYTIAGTIASENRLAVVLDAAGNPSGAERVLGTPTTEIATKLTGPFQNMGVPGAKSYHLIAPNYGDIAGLLTPTVTANPYFVRFASSKQTTVVADAMAQKPTFFSLWIGNNDMLGYASSGADGTDPLTDIATFTTAITTTVETMTKTGAKGVIANLANVTSAPYFTTVPHAPLSPLDPSFGASIPKLNDTFKALNDVFTYLGVPERSISFSTTAASAVIIKDESLLDLSSEITKALQAAGVDTPTATIYGMLYGQVRQATAKDLLVLPSASIIGKVNKDAVQMLTNLGLPLASATELAVNGVTFALTDKWVLLPTEQQEIAQMQAMYNQVIQEVATTYNLAFFDAKALLLKLETQGIVTDAGMVSASLGSGFSFDGIHPSARGYAIAANGFIKAINTKYNSTIPLVNPGVYPTALLK